MGRKNGSGQGDRTATADKEVSFETVLKNAKRFEDLVNDVAQKYPHSWENVKREMRNKKFVSVDMVVELQTQLQELYDKHPSTALIGWQSNPECAKDFEGWFKRLAKVLGCVEAKEK